MRIFVDSLKEAAADRAVVDVTAKVRLLVADIVCRVVMGRKCMEENMDGGKLSEHFDEVMRILGSFNLNDTLPFLRPFDLQGIRRRTMTVREKIDRFLEKIIHEHLQSREEGMKEHKKNDFVDVLLDAMDDKENLELELDRSSIKAMLLEVFLGTLDTSSDAIDWALVELLRHPTTMKKAQEELTRVVGPHRMVDEADLSKLPYLQMVVKESHRLHMLAPFTFRRARVDVALDGHTIPAGSNVLICNWAMARDPDFWPDAEEFVPERFESSSLDVKGHDFQLLPFGSGRRICPGVGFGLLFVPLVLAQLVHCFDWELPAGASASGFEMKEKYGLTMPRAVHLDAIPVRRPAGG
ncbi:uncharacterized protein A4U43_C09F15040 [Asparagus officinalis]|uniref:Cytochrome P450 n=2 Tax=Asparagus officinalis TaxID=4686 RepID=A0A5P1E7M1_ASPOF|nr:uncharacterized protein A4U43_C09F15040 [Asparagus officinalis]